MSAIHALNGNPPPLPSTLWPEYHGSKYSHAHVEGFNSLIKYLVRLRRDGTIDDDNFNALIKMASATFVEVEISNRIDGVLGNKAFNKALNDQLLRLLK
uniref:Uncharacterized protein n=1 Tax=Candidatus Kentrum sp. TC TaxID=2126339 RepID=A0A450Z2J1_9GAMM|nr:MAG: hypothetical protein BECKTC1821D_GA0114238_104216 [Candidatus Kentron sp. TC]VFK47938.1 MAG: hypothetical protein BECKTC1821E_GA0114239_10986 [Candidatus Kentron sp. TC]VFK60742.1 MAG: hypothetical protein BECKTC1821F_GA0114240_104913 [Candidatus Kentron sp. TC]